jgi:VWFA-related protein
VPRTVLVALAVAVTLLARPAAQREGSGPVDKPIFRLSVSLVQLDAVVTDHKGRHVTTLGPQDFQVFQDGHSQPVVAATYISTGETWNDTSGLPPLPPDAVESDDSQRVIAIVVDDLRMSFESIYYARRGLNRFVEDGFQSGDRAMLVTTSGATRGSELTRSPNVLKLAIGRLRYSLWGIRAASALDPVDGSPNDLAFKGFQEYNFAESAIDRIEDTIAMLKALPGRKSVVLVSEGFSVFGIDMDNTFIRDSIRQLVDRANRAGVVVYAVDPRGLVITGPTAADAGPFSAGLGMQRASALRESQDGLRYLTGETGGFAVLNNNDLAMGMRRIMRDQLGYYLIGYQPEAGTVSADSSGRFRSVKIKVLGKGLRVRTRSGFYGVATE